MSIRVGLRPMGRALALVAPPTPPIPPIPPLPPLILEYIFSEGVGAPYDVMYDTVHPVPATPVLISTSETFATTYSTQRKLVRLSDDTLYAVYFKQLAGKYQVYVKKSVDEGATWTDETRISTYAGMEGYHQLNPSIARDSDDYLHVVWHGRATGFTSYAQIWYSKYTDSWSAPVRISTYPGMDENWHQESPAIAVDSNDYLHVVWYGTAEDPYDWYNQIWYANYTDSWGTPVRISTYDVGGRVDDQWEASITVDSNDYIHVAWWGAATGFPLPQIWYAKYTDSWATPVRISTYTNMEDYSQAAPSIAVDCDDNVHVVWSGKASGFTTDEQIWHNKYTDSWAGPFRISTYAGMEDYGQYNPSLAVDPDDYLHVVWYGMATGFTDWDKVWYAKYTIIWVAPECIQPTGENYYPILRWRSWPR